MSTASAIVLIALIVAVLVEVAAYGAIREDQPAPADGPQAK